MAAILREMVTLRPGCPVRAVAVVEHAGVILRGLKLEESQGRYFLSTPGRRLGGSWQVLYDLRPELADELLDLLLEEYSRRGGPA
ncbi:MAG TPA: hypothetical protein VNO81_08915 [Candidatus Nitrosotenuis sp.]|jgi:hypothetical protein|nr:hypothetical protein [Candidatus Nitrosotenuis sp.]